MLRSVGSKIREEERKDSWAELRSGDGLGWSLRALAGRCICGFLDGGCGWNKSAFAMGPILHSEDGQWISKGSVLVIILVASWRLSYWGCAFNGDFR